MSLWLLSSVSCITMYYQFERVTCSFCISVLCCCVDGNECSGQFGCISKTCFSMVQGGYSAVLYQESPEGSQRVKRKFNFNAEPPWDPS